MPCCSWRVQSRSGHLVRGAIRNTVLFRLVPTARNYQPIGGTHGTQSLLAIDGSRNTGTFDERSTPSVPELPNRTCERRSESRIRL